MANETMQELGRAAYEALTRLHAALLEAADRLDFADCQIGGSYLHQLQDLQQSFAPKLVEAGRRAKQRADEIAWKINQPHRNHQ